MRRVVKFGHFAEQDLAAYFGKEKTWRKLGKLAEDTTQSDFALCEERALRLIFFCGGGGGGGETFCSEVFQFVKSTNLC